MSKIAALKNIFILLFFVGIVYMVSYYAEPVKTMVLGMLNMQDESVLGASSERAKEITGKVGSDIAGFAFGIQKQALEITLGDVIGTISRAQQIPRDVQSVHEFVKEQANNVLQSVNKKEE